MDCVKMKNYFIIGLSGFTNSGKTTIAEMLSKTIPNVEVMNQDHYFFGPDDPAIERDSEGTRNFDKLSALDMKRMVKDVKSWIERKASTSNLTHVLLIEGFLIFNHEELNALIDLKYFIQINKDICYQRRLMRQYNPPDPIGYFDKIVWPMTLENLKAIQDCSDIDFIDGLMDLPSLYECILTKIKKNIYVTNTDLT